MVIKKISAKQLQIETLNTKINIKFEESKLRLELDFNKENIEIVKPGEYEYRGFQITAVELGKDKSEGKINFLIMEVEGNVIGFITDDLSSDKELYKDLPNLDILVLSTSQSIELVKKTLNYFEVIVLVLLEGENLEELKNTLGLASLVKEKSIKYKQGDLKRNEDGQKVIGYIID